jgi:adhesin transport system outer membrane protein
VSQESLKDAYKQQFEIGQRSLLDMLDGVNKYFVTRNSLLDAQIDLKKAELRALAARYFPHQSRYRGRSG